MGSFDLRESSMEAQDVQRDVLRHAPSKAFADSSDDRDVFRIIRISQDVRYPRTDREDASQVGEGRQAAKGWHPHDSVVDPFPVVVVLVPEIDFKARQQLLQGSLPPLTSFWDEDNYD